MTHSFSKIVLREWITNLDGISSKVDLNAYRTHPNI